MIRVFESEGAKDLRLYNERKLDNGEVSIETGFEWMTLIARKERKQWLAGENASRWERTLRTSRRPMLSLFDGFETMYHRTADI